MSKDIMKRKAIILVAGMGTRLKPYTETTHKCLTQVNGVPILENALKRLHTVGITEVVLVVGYLKEQIKKHIGTCFAEMKIQYIANNDYKDTNTSRSLVQGLEVIKVSGDYEELYVLEGDVFFSCDVLNRLVDSPDKNVTVLEPYNEKLSGTFVEVSNDGFVSNWTRESRRPERYTLPDKYKTVNLYKFSKKYVEDALIPAAKNIDGQSDGRESMETVMNDAVGKYLPLKAVVLHGEKWFEIDDENDLKEAEQIFNV